MNTNNNTYINEDDFDEDEESCYDYYTQNMQFKTPKKKLTNDETSSRHVATPFPNDENSRLKIKLLQD